MSVATAQRQMIQNRQAYILANHQHFGYVQYRPMRLLEPNFVTWTDLKAWVAGGGAVNPDCSEMQSWLLMEAGLRSPSGPDYDQGGRFYGLGNTTTIWQFLGAKAYQRPQDAQVGALVEFHTPNPTHVASVYQPGADPVLFNHGGPNGPITVKLSVMLSYFGINPASSDWAILPISSLA